MTQERLNRYRELVRTHWNLTKEEINELKELRKEFESTKALRFAQEYGFQGKLSDLSTRDTLKVHRIIDWERNSIHNMEKHILELRRKENMWLYNPLLSNAIVWFIASCFIASTVYINDQNGWFDSWIPIIIGLTGGTLWSTRIHALQEAFRFELDHKQPKTHLWRWLIRLGVFLLIGCIIHFIGDGISWRSFQEGVMAACYIGSVFELTFDTWLNRDRGKSTKYVSHSKEASFQDRLIALLPDNVEGSLLLFFKIAFYVGTSCVYIKVLIIVTS